MKRRDARRGGKKIIILACAVFSAAFLSLQAHARGSAAPQGPVIDCTGRTESGQSLTLKLNGKTCRLHSATGMSIRAEVVERKVRGVGDSSRTMIALQGGELSFVDQYGCLSDARFRLDREEVGELREVRCVVRDAPACPETAAPQATRAPDPARSTAGSAARPVASPKTSPTK